jgi:hypothetical protein
MMLNYPLSIIHYLGRAPHYVRVGPFRASLRSVLRTGFATLQAPHAKA